MYKVIVAGSRGFSGYQYLKKVLDGYLQDKSKDEIEIVSGTAAGADRLGERYAKERGYAVKRFPADWDKHKGSAGYIRNHEMSKYADASVIFWDGESKGTKNMIDLSKKEDLDLLVVRYTGADKYPIKQ